MPIKRSWQREEEEEEEVEVYGHMNMQMGSSQQARVCITKGYCFMKYKMSKFLKFRQRYRVYINVNWLDVPNPSIRIDYVGCQQGPSGMV